MFSLLFVLVLALCSVITVTCSANPDRVWPTRALQFPNDESNAAPVVQEFNGILYAALTASQPNGVGVCISTSSDNGGSWSDCNWILTNDRSFTSPSLAVYNNKLFLSVTEQNPSSSTVNSVGVCIASSVDGSSWSNGCTWVLSNNVAHGAATLQVFNNQLYIAFGAHGGVGFCIASSTDGSNWSSCNWVQTQVSNTQPAFFANGSTLFLSWVQKGQLYISRSVDGISWSNAQSILSPAVSSTAPSLASWGDLIIAFVGLNNQLYISDSEDGNKWTWPKPVLSSYQLTAAPSIFAENGRLIITFADSATNVYSAVAIV